MTVGSLDSSTLPFQTLSEPEPVNPQPTGKRCLLPDQRFLAWEEFGSTSGQAVLYFHDNGSSRLEGGFFHEAARRHNVRLIAIDRPGIGQSDFSASHSPVDFCEDVLFLLDHLVLDRVAILSLGAGGIYSLTLARYFPERVNRQLSLAGVPGSVFNELGHRSPLASCWNGLTPGLVKLLVRFKQRFFPEAPEHNIQRLIENLSASDRKALANPAIIERLARDQQEALRHGHRGVAQDLAICFRKLEFKLGEVTVPTTIWQGGTDHLSQRADCEFMAANLPRARFHRLPHRGHFFFLQTMDPIFASLQESHVASGNQSLAA